jgi:hypothetical protein
MWHFQWHALKACFIIGGKWLLVPLSHMCGRTSFYVDNDALATNFHGCDLFVLDLMDALVKFTNNLLIAFETPTVIDLMEIIYEKKGYQLYNLLYLEFYILTPYIALRTLVRSGNADDLFKHFPLWLQIFLICKKTKYARLILLTLHCLEHLDPEWVTIFKKCLFVRLHEESWCTGADALVEMVNRTIKQDIPLACRNVDEIRRAAKLINIKRELNSSFDNLLDLETQKGDTRITEAQKIDINNIYNHLVRCFGAPEAMKGIENFGGRYRKIPDIHHSFLSDCGDSPEPVSPCEICGLPEDEMGERLLHVSKACDTFLGDPPAVEPDSDDTDEEEGEIDQSSDEDDQEDIME